MWDKNWCQCALCLEKTTKRINRIIKYEQDKEDIAELRRIRRRWSGWRKQAHGKPCYWCGRPVSSSASINNPRRATKEHLIPKSKGGTDAKTNIVIACYECNQKRGNSTEWTRIDKGGQENDCEREPCQKA